MASIAELSAKAKAANSPEKKKTGKKKARKATGSCASSLTMAKKIIHDFATLKSMVDGATRGQTVTVSKPSKKRRKKVAKKVESAPKKRGSKKK